MSPSNNGLPSTINILPDICDVCPSHFPLRRPWVATSLILIIFIINHFFNFSFVHIGKLDVLICITVFVADAVVAGALRTEFEMKNYCCEFYSFIYFNFYIMFYRARPWGLAPLCKCGRTCRSQ